LLTPGPLLFRVVCGSVASAPLLSSLRPRIKKAPGISVRGPRGAKDANSLISGSDWTFPRSGVARGANVSHPGCLSGHERHPCRFEPPQFRSAVQRQAKYQMQDPRRRATFCNARFLRSVWFKLSSMTGLNRCRVSRARLLFSTHEAGDYGNGRQRSRAIHQKK